jgi:2-dehydropantoate 2-reductase
MKVCVVGAGAIGGFLGVRLARAAEANLRVTALARGATLAALREHGWRMQTADGLLQEPAATADAASPADIAALGAQDLVIIAVKGQSLGAVAPSIAPLLGPDTVVLPAMNGVPWWFDASPLESVDPGGRIAAAIPQRHVLGCVVHASTSTAEPGLVVHKMGQGLIIGEPEGGVSDRARRVVALLAQAGFNATLSERIRYDIWYKLWGNMTTNPVSAMTGATADRVLDDPLVAAFCISAMHEAAAIGRCIGCAIDETPEDRHKVTRKLGAFKTSMLQDAEAGRPMEIDALVSAVREIGQRVGVATPNIDALLGLTRLFARTHGLYPDA